MGLAAYRTVSARGQAPSFHPSNKRPKGELVWVHVAEEGKARTILDLARRLIAARPSSSVLVTGIDERDVQTCSDGIYIDRLEGDHPNLATTFVAHWRPDVVLWTWGGLRPNMILAAKTMGAYMMLVDAARDGFDRRRNRWLPEVQRRLLEQFDVVIARSDAAFGKLAQLGQPISTIEVGPPLRPSGCTLPAAESDLAEIGDALRGRPVWLAAGVHPEEIAAILTAHRQAQKVSHRLLLILLLATPDGAETAAEMARQRGIPCARWFDGEIPDDSTQVLVADAMDELGLWLRTAPVAFLGGSLNAGPHDMDPYTAAAHGAAVIYGPYVDGHAASYKRMLEAGAARIISDASSLGLAVSQMIAPERAAHMAMAGWQMLTESAQSVDRIIGRVQGHLDAKQDGLD